MHIALAYNMLMKSINTTQLSINIDSIKPPLPPVNDESLEFS